MSKKYFGGINSWGKNAHDNGRFYVGEDYFTAENCNLVFSGWTLVDLPNYKSPYMFNLLKGDGSNVFAVSGGKKHLIVNFDSFKSGIEDGLWADEVHTVSQVELDAMPEGKAILLFVNN